MNTDIKSDEVLTLNCYNVVIHLIIPVISLILLVTITISLLFSSCLNEMLLILKQINFKIEWSFLSGSIVLMLNWTWKYFILTELGVWLIMDDWGGAINVDRDITTHWIMS